MNFLPKELKSKIQSHFDSIYDFINYCESDKKNKKFCIEEYKRIITKKGYTKIPSDKIVEKVFNFLKINQGKIPIATANFLFFGGNFNGDIMILFDKNLRPFFHEFITPRDNRYSDLFSERKIGTNFKKISVHIEDNISNIYPKSTSEIDNEIKKMEFIYKIIDDLPSKESADGPLLSSRLENKILLIPFLIDYIKLLKTVKNEKRKEIINKYKRIATPVIAGAGFLGTIALGKYINKKLKDKILNDRKMRKMQKDAKKLYKDVKVKSKTNSKKTKKVSKTN